MVGCQEGHQDDKNLCHLSTEVLLELKNEIIGTACQSWLTKDVTIRPCLCEAKCVCACVRVCGFVNCRQLPEIICVFNCTLRRINKNIEHFRHFSGVWPGGLTVFVGQRLYPFQS